MHSKFYFAYGSNMWLEQMVKRCANFMVLGKARLSNYKWIINKRGFATVIPSKGDFVIGTLYVISSDGETALDRFEGVKKGRYTKQDLTVSADGEYTALVYTAADCSPGKAKREYIARINKGIVDAELPPDYVKEAIRPFVPST